MIELLRQKLELLGDMLSITEAVDFSDELSAADNYINMVEDRERFVLQLKEIDREIDNFVSTPSSSTGEEDVLRKKIVERIHDIVSEDKKKREEADNLFASIKEHIVKIKQTKDLQKHYEYDAYLSDSMGKGFDERK
jgi:hypothetical protein